jgi:hypothetical protein
MNIRVNELHGIGIHDMYHIIHYKLKYSMEWHSFTNVLLGTLQQLWLQLLGSHKKQNVLCFLWIEEC